MHALVGLFLCINQHTKFEVPSFTNSKDMIGVKFNKNSSFIIRCLDNPRSVFGDRYHCAKLV